MAERRLSVISNHLTSAPPTLTLQKYDGNVALVTLNRPDKLNAFSPELLADLTQTLRSLDADETVHVIVITGMGKAFSAGADIRMFLGVSVSSAIRKSPSEPFMEYIPRVKKPIIAAVNGVALGGGFELALHCDFIYAHESARFGLPELKMGVIPGFGGTQLLTRVVGKHRAMEMVLGAETISASDAKTMGIVSKVVTGMKEAVVTEAISTAKQIAAFSLPTLLLAKQAIKGAMETTLSAGFQREMHLFNTAFALKDKEESMTAFLEKRRPQLSHS